MPPVAPVRQFDSAIPQSAFRIPQSFSPLASPELGAGGSAFQPFSLFPMSPLQACLLLSTLLFGIGLVTALSRSNTILVLLGIELMLNAANLNFIAFWRYSPHSDAATGVIFVLFSIAVAAAEAAVGLALVIAIYRHKRGIKLQEASTLKG
jgi:NADH-quinone oxidoreductase subunit K